ncbi:putative SprT family Zn-dependent metalloprotease [Microbacterium sp. AK009]|uniref:SprT-like domain-containing protein n=1 Tax=Microbacterium sp. AK009 TaxID=2723068 RepID=UPI0015CA321A|nr:SprT-like domain-containing protein [Microbacterium sp. AK009]NYF15315.1 putative SprT family Zn-dependent metalloprotease [Microbacterium sp. AK009]
MTEPERVRVWANALIRRHLDPSWTFGFDNAKRRAGLCDFRRRRISVSRYLSARYDDDTNHQTLLHEVAHALAGPAAGHGAEWKRIARELGYVGGTTHDGETAVELAPWVGVCPAGHTAYRHRRPPRATSCVACAPRFDRRHLFTWTRREISAATRLAAMTPRPDAAPGRSEPGDAVPAHDRHGV